MSNSKSVFKEVGFKESIEALVTEIQEIYLSDDVPWVVGYSGGKDSTAVLQLVWLALSRLDPAQRKKSIHVISTDTLVENPVVAAWVNKSLETMKSKAEEDGVPIIPHRLTPDIENSFWVNLIGRGYPAPRPKFRWCTERLKINPANTFVKGIVRESGEAIMVLGVRKAESAARAASITRNSQNRVRDKLSQSSSLSSCLIYSPVEEWSNDDVWMFLMQIGNPWGYNNRDLLTMYQGASPDGECPLVVDTSTPSCGDSRFGCWVCTLVEKDKSMQAMIQNDDEKEWMLPLLKLRNELDVADDTPLRDFRRMKGMVQLFNGRLVHGPYTQESREAWLRKLLEAQLSIKRNPRTPENIREIELITMAELGEIRRIWLTEKHELEDSLPRIYEEITGEVFDVDGFESHVAFGAEEMMILKKICEGQQTRYELSRELLSITQSFSSQSRRAGLYNELERAIRRGFYKDKDDAFDFAQRKQQMYADLEPTESGLSDLEPGSEREGS